MNSSKTSPANRTRKPFSVVFGRSRVRPVAIFFILATLATAGFSATSSAGSLHKILFGKYTAPASEAKSEREKMRAAASAALASPSADSPSLPAARKGHTATLLDNGKVLLVGGDETGTAEVYDPASAASAATNGLSIPRADHTATKLADGRVIVIGGRSGGTALNTTEIYNTTTGSFEAGPSMGVARAGHSATLLFDGKILVVGGDEGGSAEIFNPAAQPNESGTLSTFGMGARSMHSAALMQDGRVLVVGGRDAGGNALASAEIFDPAASALTPAGNNLKVARVRAHLRVLFDGKVQIIGGSDDGSMEVYDPAADTVGAYAHVLPESDTCAGLSGQIMASQTRAALFHNGQADALLDRTAHTITELPATNQALVAGGVNTAGAVLNTFSLLNSSAATISTDKLDYLPGEEATITGRGFQPGETVRLKIHEDPHTPQERGFDITADAEGNFSGKYLVQDYDFTMKFIVGARGLTSGRTAQTTFTDGNATVSGTVKSSAAGNPAINGATISNSCDSQTTTSNASGNYILSNVNFSGSSNTCSFTASAPGFASQTISNVSLANGTPATVNFTLTPNDTTPPTVSSIARAATSPTNAASVSWTVTFSESVTGVDALDFALATSGLTGTPAISGVTGSGATYTVTASTGNGTGTLGLNLNDNDSIVDGVGNKLGGTGIGTAGGGGAGNGSFTGQVYSINRTLTPQITAANKTYDGTNAATILTRTFTSSLTVTEDVSVTGGTATFSDKNVGNGKTVTATGLSLTGTAAGKYVLSTTSATTTADITARSLTVSATGQNKVYDGATNATVTLNDNRVSGDVFTVSYTSATFANKNVGPGKTVTVNGISISGADAANYTVNTSATTTADITARPLTVSATAQNKVYDGNTSATVTLSDNRVSGDTFTVSYTGATFDTKNVGTSKPVTVNGISISGGDAGNYSLTSATANATADITPRTLNVTATGQNKVYDGTNSATVTLNDDRVSGDSLTLSYTSATFTDKHVGTAKAVGVTGVSISGGADAGNYTLASTGAATTADITAKPITVTAVTDTKVYDGTNSSAGTPSIAPGLAVGDTAAFTQSFDTKNAGTNKTLTPSGSVSDGNGGANYNVTFANNTTGEITPRPITVTAAADSKEYDGTTSSGGVPTVTGGSIAPGDTGNFTQTFDNRNAGTGKTLTPAGSVSDGNGGANYNVTFANNTNGVITAKPITVTAVSDTKTYDGTNSSAGSPSVSPALVGGDTSGFVQAFDNRNAGNGKTLIPSGSANDGNGGANYAVTFVNDTTGVINPLAITVTAAADTKVYDGTTNSAGTPSIAPALVGGDTSGFTQSFDNRNVGTNKTLAPSGSVSDGNGGANYSVTFVNNTTGVITAAPLTITAQTNTKNYDGTNGAAATPTVSGLQGSDTVTGLAEVYDNKNVGTGKTLSVSAYTVNDGNSGGNYNVTTVADTTGVINKAALTITAVTNTKTYDGNTSAAATPTVSGLQGSDTVTGLSETYDTANAGTGKTLSVSAYTVNDGNSGNNYNVTTVADTTGVIGKANAAIVVTPYSVTYDGAAHTATGSATGVNSESLSGLDLSGTTHTNAGTYNGDPWTFTDVTGNYNDASGTVDDVINKAVADCSSIAGYTGTYDAAAHGATGACTGVAGDPTAAGGSLNLGASFTNVPGGTANWSFTGGTNYTDQSGSVAISISKATADCSSIVGYTGTYDTAAHGATGGCTGVAGDPTAAGSSLSLGASFTDVPGGTASWSFTGGTNYTDQAGSVAIVINKATADCSSIAGYSGTYDAAAHGASGTCAGVAGDPSAAGSSLNLGASFTAVPGGTANWSFTGGNNYTDQSGSVAIVINKAVADCSSIAGHTGTYDAATHGATGACTGVAGDPSAAGSSLNLGASFTDVPGGTANWSFTGGNNYTDQNGSVAIVINKATADCSSIVGYTGTYDAAAHGAAGTCTGVAGDPSAAGSTLNLGASFTVVPGGTANWSFTGGNNYTDQNGSVAIVINKAVADCSSIIGHTGTYDAAAHGASGSCVGVAGDSAAAGSSLNLGASFTNVPGGTANWSFTGGTNYTDQGGSVAIVINKATADCSSILGYTGNYDAAAHGATGTCTGVAGDPSAAGGSLNLGASFTNVPGGTANWSFTGGTNYTDQSGGVAIVINKATADCSSIVGYSGTYDAATHGAGGTCAGVAGDPSAAGSSLNLGASFTNVPGGTANWSFTGGTNYADQNGSVAIVISKAVADCSSITGYTGTYDATAHGASGTCAGVAADPSATGSSLSLGASFTNVPGGTANWSFTGGNNYTDQGGSVAIVINKATADCSSIVGYTGTYDAAAHGASGACTGVAGDPTAAGSSLNLGASFTNVPGGTANWSFTGGTNYADQSGGVAIVINKAGLTITAVTNTKTYDGNNSAAGVPTVSGLKGGDSVTALAETYDNKNAGTGKTLSVSAYTVNDGNSGNNYSVTTVADMTGVINKAGLTITASTNTKTYDGTTGAAATPTVSAVQPGDSVTGLAEVYDDKNVGAGKTLSVSAYTVNDGNSGGNYNVTLVSNTTGVIDKAALTITAVTNNRVYDGTTTAAALPTVSGLQPGDTVTGRAETYDNKNAGTGKTLSVSAYTVNDGNSGGNYNVSTVSNTTGVITQRAITATAVATTKIYDGTTSSPGTPTVSPTPGGIASGDTPNFTQTYDTPLAGAGKTLTPSGSVNDGNGGLNYAVTFVNSTNGVVTTGYCFNGFLPPIGGSVETMNGGSFADPVRSFKLGSTIPVKFAIRSWNGTTCGNPVITGIHTLQVAKYNNATEGDTPIDATPTDAATTGNQFRLTDSEWHFNLNTKGLTQGTYLLKATLQDGSVHTVWITIKK